MVRNKFVRWMALIWLEFIFSHRNPTQIAILILIIHVIPQEYLVSFMAKKFTSETEPVVVDAAGLRFALVVSRFNSEITERLLGMIKRGEKLPNPGSMIGRHTSAPVGGPTTLLAGVE